MQRRKYLTAGASLFVGSIAGCTSGSEGTQSTENAGTTDESEPESTTSRESGSDTTDDSESESYSVTVQPYGSHTFEEVPETYLTQNWIDFGMAFNIPPKATGGFISPNTKFYDLLPGLNWNPDEITQVEGRSNYSKETFYQVDPDVILVDPRHMKYWADWDDQDIEEIANNVAPFLGSQLHTPIMGEEPYYEMYEAFEKVAQIFQRQEQFAAWEQFHDEVLEEVQSRLPPEDERPTATLLINGIQPDSGNFTPANINGKRKDTHTLRQLGVKDAFANMEVGGQVGYEALLEVDPDFIVEPSLSRGTYDRLQNQILGGFKNNNKGSQLTAVQNENVVRVAGTFMGPIIELFSLEAGAKQIYPDEFGEWPGPVGELSEDEKLFDRDRLTDIILGNV
ncbi:hypothetical protein Harman_39550 [Haloarcula mannanilytica]|uniref:Fe/B12 periplasmic-binding domain-containing protein n=1 Tax=Haloarcula mannanilytica TaxID=2509225 RepID=A0A4C2ER90_9EURY|nr:ABC transporter substrate-binding protein [Haloarcula mannanilytica]GCF16020.1 hypothetical protein Harman_39550 [Haloarcula mannanilytica]